MAPSAPSDRRPARTPRGERHETPILGIGELESYIQEMAEFEDRTPPLQQEIAERLSRVPTRPAPPTLTTLYTTRMMQVDGDDALEDRELVEEVVRLLDPLITGNHPAQTIYEAVQAAMECTEELEHRKQVWDISVAALQSVVEGLLSDVADTLFDDDQALALGRYLCGFLRKIISPAVRFTFVRTLRSFLLRDDVLYAAKQRTTQAFVYALVFGLQELGEFPAVLCSEAAQKAFQETRIVLPKPADRSLAAFTLSYPGEDNALHQYFLAHEEESEQAQEALSLLRETEHLGIFPADLEGFDAEAYAALCKRYFIRVYRIIKLEGNRYTQVMLFKTWSEILAPQLLVLGDLLLPDSPFLLPKPR
jgi:hypothetical protein